MYKYLFALLLISSGNVISQPLSVHLVSFTGTETGNKLDISWQVDSVYTGDMYVVEKRADLSASFAEAGRVTVASERASKKYSIEIPLTMERSFYRLKIISVNGQVSYSQIISPGSINRQTLRTFITGTNLMCKLALGTTAIEIFDANGKSLLKQQTAPEATYVNISLANIIKGIITVRAITGNGFQVARVLY